VRAIGRENGLPGLLQFTKPSPPAPLPEGEGSSLQKSNNKPESVSCAGRRRRRGLSTLEMVLALPILLFIMALIVNFGTVATWKVRGQSMARQAVWATRWPRSGGSDPRPDYWPDNAGVRAGGAGNLPELDDPRVDLPVARGPMILDTPVNRDLLDPTRGLRQGSADLTRRYPMLGKLGRYRFETKTFILDDKWQYRRMGLSWNKQRRIPVIYALRKAPAGMVQAYINAVTALVNAPFQPQLYPLDRDEEFIDYSARFAWGTGAPDFHPGLHMFCTLDRQVSDRLVEDLIGRIEGLPKTMATAFIRLYQRVIQELQSRLNGPLPPGQQAAIQAEIAQLQAKIAQLNQFLQSLP